MNSVRTVIIVSYDLIKRSHIVNTSLFLFFRGNFSEKISNLLKLLIIKLKQSEYIEMVKCVCLSIFQSILTVFELHVEI